MLKRIVWLLIAFPAAVFLITLAIANRHTVRLVLDPFRPEQPVLSVVLPFYALSVRGAAHRRAARRPLDMDVAGPLAPELAAQLAATRKRWQAEADRLTRERDAEVSGRAKELPAPGRRDAA